MKIKPSLTRKTLIVLIFLTKQLTGQSLLKTVLIKDFKTIRGIEINNCKITYRTLGKINVDKSNVILWPTWFNGKSEHICDGLAPVIMDTTSLFIISVDAFGNGNSSSPSNSPNFPKIAIRDMVNSTYILLTKYLEITHVKAIVVISMGAMQTFEWLTAYPGFTDKAIAIEGTPKQSSYDLLFWKTQAAVINMAKKNKKSMDLAMKTVSNVGLLNTYSPSFWFRKYPAEKVDSIMLAAQKNTLQVNPYNFLCQLDAMITHDIYRNSGKALNEIKSAIQSDVLIIVSKSDHAVNPNNGILFAKAINAKLIEIDTDCGHNAIFCDEGTKAIKINVNNFLKNG